MRLSKSFVCSSLEFGTKLIGALSLISSLITALSLTVDINDIYGNVIPSEGATIKIIIAGVAMSALATGTAAALMIYGAHRNNPDLVFPWLALETSHLIISASVILGFVIVGPTIMILSQYLILVAFLAIVLAVTFYIWFIVWSFYKNQIDPLPCNEMEILDKPCKISYEE